MGMRSSSIPATDLFKVDEKAIWVIHISDIEEKKYRSYEEVKDQLEQMLKERALGDVSVKKLSDLRTKYKVEDFREARA